MEVKVRPVRLVDEKRDAPGVHQVGDAPQVGAYPEVGGVHDEEHRRRARGAASVAPNGGEGDAVAHPAAPGRSPGP